MISYLLEVIGINKWFILGAAGLMALSATTAWQVQDWRYGLQIAELESQHWQTEIARKQRVVESQRLQNNIKDLISQNRQLAEKKQKTVTEYVNKEVIRYVQSPDAGTCQFNDQWVRVYDSAAGMSETDTAAGTDADATRITDIEVLENATGNYATCHDIRQDLISLQDWVRQTYEVP